MKNYISEGEVVKVTAGQAYSGGDGVALEDRAGVASHDCDSGADLIVALCGVYRMEKAAVALAIGEKLYWDDSADKVTNVSSGNKAMGWGMSTQASGDSEVDIKLGAF